MREVNKDHDRARRELLAARPEEELLVSAALHKRFFPPPRGLENLSGRKIGKMTVVCYSHRPKRKHHLWLCRCICGLYEMRAGHTIRRGREEGDECCQCRRTTYLKKIART